MIRSQETRFFVFLKSQLNSKFKAGYGPKRRHQHRWTGAGNADMSGLKAHSADSTALLRYASPTAPVGTEA